MSPEDISPEGFSAGLGRKARGVPRTMLLNRLLVTIKAEDSGCISNSTSTQASLRR